MEQRELSSYLIEITRDIMAYKNEDGEPVIDTILDAAGQKGTGKWTVIAALDAGIPLSLISESVFARCLSAQKEERVSASLVFSGPDVEFSGNRQEVLDELEKALYLAKIISYTQGFNLMMEASEEYDWDLNFGEIARIWRGGCIIRSVFLDKLQLPIRRILISIIYCLRRILKRRLIRPSRVCEIFWQLQSNTVSRYPVIQVL